jgi:HlyD family secretion protein
VDETSKKTSFFSKNKKSKQGLFIISIAILLLGGAGVAGYQIFMAPAQAEAAFLVVSVGKGDVTETVLASGTVQASKRTSLSFADAEDAKDVISSILVEVGDQVKAGQVLATMDDSVAKMQLINAEANLLSAGAKLEEAQKRKSSGEMSTLQAAVNQAKMELDLAAKSIDLEKARNEDLKAKAALEKAEKNDVSQKALFDAGAISRTEYETAQMDLEQAKRDHQTAVMTLAQANGQATSKLEQAQAVYQTAVEGLEEAQKGPDSATILSAKAAVEQAKAQLQQSQTALNAVTLKAPMDGVIVQLNGNVGEVPANDFIVMDNSNSGDLEVLAQISESDIGKVKEGLPVTFSGNTYPDQAFTGKVKLVYPEAKTNSGVTTYDVLLSVDNREGLLKIGMTMNVTVEIGTHRDVLVIPAAALQSLNGKDGVFLMNKGSEQQQAPSQTSGQTQQPQKLEKGAGPGPASSTNGPSQPPYRFQPVKIGYFASDRVEIIEGLSEGDQIVILPTAASSASGKQQMIPMGGPGGTVVLPSGS